MAPYNRSDKEEEYFLKLEAQKLKEQAEQHKVELEAKELERLRELHYMRCPKCGLDLEEISYCRIKIDKCFSCGGVWLDDGELEAVAASEGSGGVFAGLSRIFKGKDEE